MIKNQIKTILANHGSFLTNIGYLSVVQVVNMLLPLITYPYLIKVLGSNNYGLIIFYQAIIAYLIILINFGFDIHATKEVSINRGNKDALSKIVSTTYIAKGCLFILSLILATVSIFIFPKISENKLLFLLLLYLSIYEFLFPVWFFQGIEKMKYIAIANFLSRTLLVLGIFIFIKHSSDLLLVPVINGIGAIFACLIGLWLVFYKENIHFKFYSFKEILKVIKSSSAFFVSRVSAVINVRTNTIIIGSFLGTSEVVYYDLAVKVVEILKLPNSVINSAVYPRIANSKDKIFAKKILYIRIFIGVILYLFCLIAAKPIAIFVSNEMMDAIPTIRLMGLLLILTSISYYSGISLLVAFGYPRIFNRSVIYSTILYLSISGILIYLKQIGLYSVVLAIIIVELYIVLYRLWFCYRKKIL